MKFIIGWSVLEYVVGSIGGIFILYVILGKYFDVVSLSGLVWFNLFYVKYSLLIV